MLRIAQGGFVYNRMQQIAGASANAPLAAICVTAGPAGEEEEHDENDEEVTPQQCK